MFVSRSTGGFLGSVDEVEGTGTVVVVALVGVD